MNPDLRIAQLQSKLEIELKCKEGGEAMLDKLTDKNALAQCHASIADSNQRIQFLISEIERLRHPSQYQSEKDLHALSSRELPALTTSLQQLVSDSQLQNKEDLFLDTHQKSSSLLSYFRKVIPSRNRSSVSSLENSPRHSTFLIHSSKNSQELIATSIESIKQTIHPTMEHLLVQGPDLPGTVLPRNDTQLEWSRSGVGLSNLKISNKLRDLTYKLDIDLKYKQASGKMDALLHSNNALPKSKSNDVGHVQAEYHARIEALRASIQKYNSLFVPESLSAENVASISSESSTLVSTKRGQSGTFTLFLSSARLPPSVKNVMSRNMVNYYQALIRIDGITQAKSKLIKFPKDRTGTDTILVFQEEYKVLVNNAIEAEIVIVEVDKSERIHAVNGLLWFRIADVMDHLSLGWFELDPTGHVLFTATFQVHSVKYRKNLSKLGRQGAVLRKKKIELNANGHSFVLHPFSNIMKCGLCSEFIGIASCYVCEACQFACHKKCAHRVITKCIAQPALPNDHSPSLLHRIPHRFQPSQQLLVHWCCWCGHMLALGRTFQKCTECDLAAHDSCSILIPNFCGMSMQRANLMLQEIRLADSMKSAAALKSPAVSPQSTSVNTTTPLNKMLSSLASKWTENDFKFLSVLGRGNFGKVILAEEKKTGRLFALKILKKNFVIENGEVESILSEKRIFLIANHSQHPFLLNLFACFQSETRLYFVMEYVPGGDLMLHIQRQQFSEQRSRFYACEVLLALEYFHQNDIIYRDLKLDNIMLGMDGHIKVADYGLCKEHVGYNMTTNTFCGTPEFMAPEILYEQQYTRVVDWWAFGVLIYEMICGQSPFRGEDEDEIFESILHDEVLYPITMSKEAVSICQALLSKDPKARLGNGPEDALEIKRHSFFKGVDWDRLLAKKVMPPFLPKLQSITDVSNFDEEFTKEPPVLTPVPSLLEEMEQKEFDGFSFTGDFETVPKNHCSH